MTSAAYAAPSAEDVLREVYETLRKTRIVVEGFGPHTTPGEINVAIHEIRVAMNEIRKVVPNVGD